VGKITALTVKLGTSHGNVCAMCLKGDGVEKAKKHGGLSSVFI
jgi:hypothetical protein